MKRIIWKFACFMVFLGVCFTQVAFAAQTIPQAAHQYRAQLTREAHFAWGLNAPVATFAAQIQQESAWNAQAKSHAGAQGLAQFMPATAKWLPEVAPQTGEPMPYNAAWSIRALVTYDLWLWQRVNAHNDCHRMAMTLSAYNGGLGWVQRDAKLAKASGLDPTMWWDHVETVNAGRSANAKRENQGYPRRILLVLEPLYHDWGGGMCHD